MPPPPPPPPQEADDEDDDIGIEETQAAPAPAPRRATPPARGRTPSGAGAKRQAAPQAVAPPEAVEGEEEREPERKGRGGEQIGVLARRGMSLTSKVLILALLVSLPITLLFGMVALHSLSTQLVDEIKRSGYQQALILRGYGQFIVSRFKDVPPQQFDEILEKYHKGLTGDPNKPADPAFKRDMEFVQRMLEGDRRIKDVAIFASPVPVDTPNRVVVRGDPSAPSIEPAPSVSFTVNVAKQDPDVLIYRGYYGGEPCLYFRVPLQKAPTGEKGVYSTAMLILASGEIDAQVGSLRNQLVLFGILLVGAGVGLALGLASRITRPINGLVEDINIVAKGDLDYESDVPNQTSDEIGLLAMAFNRMTRSLRDAQVKERDRERMESELNSAKAVHARLLPEKMPQLAGIDICTAYNSAKEVGGDYYDFIPVGDLEHLALCVADVSGKGIPGSMVMGTTRTILRMMAVNNRSALDVLSKTNFHVARDIKRGMFVTCMYTILNVRTKEMTVASAGHNPMLVWRAASKTIEKVRPNGIALGFDKGPVFNRTIREQKLQLYQGDRVVLYTDGVVESMNEAREEWGDEALDAFTLKHAEKSSKEYVHLLTKALEEHQGGAEQHDDITIVTFRIA